MTPEQVIEIAEMADRLGLTMFVAGGWGVDALAGHQTRAHADLDVGLEGADADRLEAALAENGFQLEVDGSPARRAWRHPDGREVDVHPLVAEPDGSYHLVTSDGAVYRWPRADLTEGSVAGHRIRCLSPRLQLQLHEGYEPTEHDLADQRLLRNLARQERLT